MAGFRTRFPAVTPRRRSCCQRAWWFRRCFGQSDTCLAQRPITRPGSSRTGRKEVTFR